MLIIKKFTEHLFVAEAASTDFRSTIRVEYVYILLQFLLRYWGIFRCHIELKARITERTIFLSMQRLIRQGLVITLWSYLAVQVQNIIITTLIL